MRYMKWLAAFGLLASLGACYQDNSYPSGSANGYGYSNGYAYQSQAAARSDRYWNSANRDYDRDGVPNRYDRDANGDGVPDRYQGRPRY